MRLWLFAIIAVLCVAPSAFAQFSIGESSAIVVTPQYPRANSSVTFELQSVTFDPNSANIRWSVNGEVKQNQVGGKRFTTTTGEVGKLMTITVDIIPQQGVPSRQMVTIVPNEVDMVWESLTYTPPLYQGRSLPVKQGDIRVQAIPTVYGLNGVKLDPATLIYTWKVNGEGQGITYNQSSFVFRANILEEPTSIEVLIKNKEKTITAYGQLTIETGEPQIVLYEQHPQLGVLYNRALGVESNSPYTGFVIAARPYFYSIAMANSADVKYTWRVNGNQEATTESSIALHYPEGSSGYIPVQAQVQNNIRIFQRGTGKTDVIVGAPPSYKFQY